jgi:hypothetical protein
VACCCEHADETSGSTKYFSLTLRISASRLVVLLALLQGVCKQGAEETHLT